jgi:hypothetical protein
LCQPANTTHCHPVSHIRRSRIVFYPYLVEMRLPTPGAALLLLFVTTFATATSSSWSTVTFVATRASADGDFSVSAFLYSLADELDDVHANHFVIENVSAVGSKVTFAVAAPPGNLTRIRSDVLDLSQPKLASLGLATVELASAAALPPPPPPNADEQSTWIVGAIIGGLAVAGVSVGFAEYKARSARARRKARASAPASGTTAGMLCDN